MSARPLLILATVAVVLGAILVLSNRPTQRTNVADSLFAPSLAERLDDVQTVRIVGAGNATVASLTRTDNDWIVEERDGYRANTDTIRSALTLLSRATVIEAKTSNPAEFERLGVESLSNSAAGGIGIEFLPDSLGLPGIVLGEPTGTSYRYARLADSDQSWLINADPEVPEETTQWLDAEILSIDGSRIERILIEHADGEILDIFKTAPDQSNYTVADIPEGRTLQYPGVANVIGNVLRGLRLEDVAAAGDVAGTPEITTTFETFDGLVVTARGYDVEGNGWLEFSAQIDTQFSNPDEAVSSEAQELNERLSGWRYRIPDYQYNQIARRMDDLLSAEETAEESTN
ncbi:MAG: DUF4340 domain-containing protein [Gammaproteobacteria bacterium]